MDMGAGGKEINVSHAVRHNSIVQNLGTLHSCLIRLPTILLLINFLKLCNIIEIYKSNLSRHTNGSGSGSDLVESGIRYPGFMT
jgi:hypothetical protein